MGAAQKGRGDNRKKENSVGGQRGGGTSRKKENSVGKVTIGVINGGNKG